MDETMLGQVAKQIDFKKSFQIGVRVSSIERFSDLYDQYHRRVRSVLYRMGAKEDLDDLVQEVFLKAWRAFPTFKRQSRFSTWIYRIAMNTAIDRFRKFKYRGEFSATFDEEKIASDHSVESKVENLESQQLILSGLDQLNSEQRSVLVLHLMEGKKIKEVADILRLPSGTVKSRLFYAKQSMQNYLSSRGVSL